MNWWERIKPRLGLVILGGAFLVALGRVLTLGSQGVIGQKKIIRMVHWQLEANVREALDEVGREYMKRHPDVVFEQIPIGERGYLSWVMTRLIGGTAPELIEVGMGLAANPIIFLRYFQPLSEEILRPNPYNAGTELEGVPWRDTYYDNMMSGFVPELLDYYYVPSSAFTVRLFYNKTRFKEYTGLDAPPREFGEFIAVCEQIRARARARGERVVPIAGAGRYNTRFMFNRFEVAVSSTLLETVDVNLDSDASSEESAFALLSGAVSFRDPRIRAMFRARDYYIPQFQPAFYPADRMDAAFLFIQQKALMIASGAWDAASYLKQANFEIGVCDFPLPGRDHPEFGAFVEGPPVEILGGAFSFAVNRTAAHPDVALDFLKFATSQPINDLYNRTVKWIPMIRGNVPDPFIAPFWPNFYGVKPGINLDCGPYARIALDELDNLYATGRLDFDEFMRRFEPRYRASVARFLELDRPRGKRIACATDEFRGRQERVLGGGTVERAVAILEGTLSQRFNDVEIAQRYAAVMGRGTGGGAP